jgi:16S rRNA processing protein RimM
MGPSSDELDPASAVRVGVIATPFGIRGELKVQPLTDFPARFRPGQLLWLQGEPRRIERSRWDKNDVVVKLEGIETRTQAEGLRGETLMIPEAAALDSDRYYLHDIIGLRVVDAAGETLGKVEDVLSTGANDVYVVRGDRGELLLPAIDDVVKEVDLAAGRLVVELLEGLEFHKSVPSSVRRRSRGSGGAAHAGGV